MHINVGNSVTEAFALNILPKTVLKAVENLIQRIPFSPYFTHVHNFVCLVDRLPYQLIFMSLQTKVSSFPCWAFVLTLVSCAASEEMTESDNIIYIVCGERLQHYRCIYATLGDLPELPSPGPIHQMAFFPNAALLKHALERVLTCRSVFICVRNGALWVRARAFVVYMRRVCVCTSKSVSIQ